MKDEPRNANVVVKSDSVVVQSIGKDVFNPFLQREEGFRRFIGACCARARTSCVAAQARGWGTLRWAVTGVPVLARGCARVSTPGVAVELVGKKEEATLRRMKIVESEAAGDDAKRDVKISVVRRRMKTKSFKTIINNFVLMDKLGQGSFGQVRRVACGAKPAKKGGREGGPPCARPLVPHRLAAHAAACVSGRSLPCFANWAGAGAGAGADPK